MYWYAQMHIFGFIAKAISKSILQIIHEHGMGGHIDHNFLQIPLLKTQFLFEHHFIY